MQVALRAVACDTLQQQQEKTFDLAMEVDTAQVALLALREQQINSLISEVDLWKARFENDQNRYKSERRKKRKWAFTAIGAGFLAMFLAFSP